MDFKINKFFKNLSKPSFDDVKVAVKKWGRKFQKLKKEPKIPPPSNEPGEGVNLQEKTISPQKGKLGRIGKLFKKSHKKEISPEQLQYIKETHEKTVEDEQLFNTIQPSKKFADPTQAVIPKDLSLQKRGEAVKNKGKLTKAQVLETCKANGWDNMPDSQPLIGSDGKEWKALAVRNGKVEENKISPTWERTLEGPDSNHLTNIYYHISDDGRISISCGLIETMNKADEFMEAVKFIVNKYCKDNNLPRYDKKLRITMHQLNSNHNEKEKIRRQRKMGYYINHNLPKKLKGKLADNQSSPIVAYVNRCFNGFSSLPLEKEFVRHNNVLGLGIQARWLLDDLKNESPSDALKTNFSFSERCLSPQFLPVLNEIASLSEEIDALKYKKFINKEKEENPQFQEWNNELTVLMDNPVELEIEDLLEDNDKFDQKKLAAYHDWKKKVDTLAKKIDDFAPEPSDKKDILQKQLRLKSLLKSLPEELDKLKPEILEEAGPKVAVFSKIVNYEINRKKKYSATQKLMFEMVNDLAMGAITQKNCFSGLDRTGFARSLYSALSKKYEKLCETEQPHQAISELIAFIEGYEDGIKQLDKKMVSYHDDLKNTAQELLELYSTETVKPWTSHPEIKTELENAAKSGASISFATYEKIIAFHKGGITLKGPDETSFRSDAATRFLNLTAEDLNLGSPEAAEGIIQSFKENKELQQLAEGAPLTPEMLKNLETFKNTHSHFLNANMEKVFNYFTENHFSNPIQEHQAIASFQADVFHDLMQVALPITGRSTGVNGLKWHNDAKNNTFIDKIKAQMGINPHPVSSIPYFVFDEELKKNIQMIELDKKGKRFFTDEAKALLNGLSQARGS